MPICAVFAIEMFSPSIIQNCRGRQRMHWNWILFFSLTAAFSVAAVAYFLRFSRDDWLEFYIPDINSLSFFRTCLWVNFEFLREKFIILYLQGL